MSLTVVATGVLLTIAGISGTIGVQRLLRGESWGFQVAACAAATGAAVVGHIGGDGSELASAGLGFMAIGSLGLGWVGLSEK